MNYYQNISLSTNNKTAIKKRAVQQFGNFIKSLINFNKTRNNIKTIKSIVLSTARIRAKAFIKHALLLISLLLSSTINAASYVYVTDMVPIPMRSENKIQNNPSNLIGMLDSGTKLEILATDEGWTKVKFNDIIGWIISRYLTSDVPARVKLEELQSNNNNNELLLIKHSEKNAMLEKFVDDLKIANNELSIQVGKLESEKKHIQQTYKDSLKLDYENTQLQAKILQLQAQIQLLNNNSTVGQDTSHRNWFIVGALVLFCGFIIGFIFTRRNNRIFLK